MAARTLEELQKQYNGKPHEPKRGMPMPGPRGPMGRGPMGPRGKQGGKPKNTRATMKRLFSYLIPYRFRLLLVLLCMLLNTASSLLGAYILRPILNALVGVGETKVLGFHFDSPMDYLAVVLAVVLVFTGLWAIDFISDAFALVLIGGTSLWGAFRAGQVWSFHR